MDRQAFFGVHGALAVDGLAHDVEHAPERRLAHGHRDGGAGVYGLAAAGDAVGGGERDAADVAAADLLYDLHDDLALRQAHLHRVVQLRELPLGEVNVHHRADHAFDNCFFHTRNPPYRLPFPKGAVAVRPTEAP